MVNIEYLLHRRTDLSTFLVHLTRAGDDGESAYDNLLSITESNLIEARTPMGATPKLEKYLTGTSATQKVVCFTETPLEHTWMMLEQIENRRVQFEPYGLAITKPTARKALVNPVWYSDITPTRGWRRSWPIHSVNELTDDAKERSKSDGIIDVDALASEPIFQLTPYFEQMGPMNDGGRKEFWWEREWRHIDDYEIDSPDQVVALFAPEQEHSDFRADLKDVSEQWARRPVLDPNWGLERMIAELADISPKAIGPFPR